MQVAKEVDEVLGQERIEVIETESMEVTIENSPVGESESNGLVERAIQSVQEQIRAIKNIVEAEAKMKIGPDTIYGHG